MFAVDLIMAAPIGNQNAVKGTRWRNAIEKALENRCKSDGQKALVQIAERLLEKAMDGDVSALRELGDRMDGKAAQALIHQGDAENPVMLGGVKLVKPGKKDGG